MVFQEENSTEQEFLGGNLTSYEEETGKSNILSETLHLQDIFKEEDDMEEQHEFLNEKESQMVNDTVISSYILWFKYERI